MRRIGRSIILQPLIDYLADCPATAVTLTFREIAALIGRPLPERAILQPSWWRDRANRPVQCWQATGWEARADRDRLRVVFTRIGREE